MGLLPPPRLRIMESDSKLWNALQRAGHALRLRGALANEPSARILHYILLGLASSLIIEVVAAPF